MKTLNKIVIGVLIYWVSFVAVMTTIFCVKSAVPDTLIQYGLGGGAVELLATALIEIFKTKWEKGNDKEADNRETDEPEILGGAGGVCDSDTDSL